jgi:hypothetical protein
MNIQLLVFAPSQIETWPIDRLRPYARNAKIHGTDQVAKIAASMAKFGCVNGRVKVSQRAAQNVATLGLG